MDFFQDKRFWYAVGAVIIVVIAVAIWTRSGTEVPPPKAATSAPATPPAAPAKQ